MEIREQVDATIREVVAVTNQHPALRPHPVNAPEIIAVRQELAQQIQFLRLFGTALVPALVETNKDALEEIAGGVKLAAAVLDRLHLLMGSWTAP
jgi:hypothetical protein